VYGIFASLAVICDFAFLMNDYTKYVLLVISASIKILAKFELIKHTANQQNSVYSSKSMSAVEWPSATSIFPQIRSSQ